MHIWLYDGEIFWYYVINKLEKLVFINSDKTLGLQIQLLKTNAMKTKYFYKYMPDVDVCFLAFKHHHLCTLIILRIYEGTSSIYHSCYNIHWDYDIFYLIRTPWLLFYRHHHGFISRHHHHHADTWKSVQKFKGMKTTNSKKQIL